MQPTKQILELETEIEAALGKLPNLKTATIRALRGKFSTLLSNTSGELVFQLALRLVNRSDSIRRFIGYELIQHHREASRSLNSKRLTQLGQQLDSWVAVDTFACYLSGPAWREGQVPDSLIIGWTRSKNRWWRRAALVSTVPLNNKARGGDGDVPKTLAICEILLNDRDDMVVKALSWALREAAKRDHSLVADFVSRHAKLLAPRVVLEVNNKLETGLKNPKRR